MIAAFVRRTPVMWRSRQFTEAFSFPPTNHFACGGFQSRTFFHGLSHWSSFAQSAQNASGFFAPFA